MSDDRLPGVDEARARATWTALGGVFDPELGLDLVSLGLVYAVDVRGDAVEVTMTLTTPGCPAAESMPEMARYAIAETVGADVDVRVHLVWSPPWELSMMSDAAARRLGVRRPLDA